MGDIPSESSGNSDLNGNQMVAVIKWTMFELISCFLVEGQDYWEWKKRNKRIIDELRTWIEVFTHLKKEGEKEF